MPLPCDKQPLLPNVKAQGRCAAISLSVRWNDGFQILGAMTLPKQLRDLARHHQRTVCVCR